MAFLSIAEMGLRQGLELPVGDRGGDGGEADQGGDGAQVRGTSPRASGSPGRCARYLSWNRPARSAPSVSLAGSDGACPGRKSRITGTTEAASGTPCPSRTLSAPKPPDELPGQEAPKDEAGDRAASHQPEEPPGLARGQHLVGQGPDLRGGEHAIDAHPDVERRVEPGGLVVVGAVPEHEGIHGEEGQAAHQKVAQRGGAGDADIDRHHEAHDDGDGDGHVREVHRGVLSEEQRRPRRFPDDVARDDEEQVGEEQPAAAQVLSLQVEQPLEQAGQGQALVTRNGA